MKLGETMLRSIYIALGFLVARWIFRRQSRRVDPLARLRQAGL